ncbi:transporter substrate-binding domain-containing protein [uncultured Pseudoteredinibacter sp.]|uniref:substrate-binding periplasmic protein n=1 Tax=uncultured Pseudoteredinibacter sp. TaxID=1641701 RepID=UPI002622394D|nr:transporter substrate-binding domain-containing protein [uncultured Pseudoteredinibacter sp.]
MKSVSVLCILFMWALSSSSSVEAKSQSSSLQFSSVHYPPFVVCNKDNVAVDGLDVRILSAVAKKLNIKLSVHCSPWRRSLHEVAAGNLDGVFPLYITDKRKSWANFIMTPLHYESYVLASHSNGQAEINKLGDLFNKRLGLHAGFYVNKKFEQSKEEKHFSLKEFNSLELGLKALQRDRIDYYISNITTLGHVATKMGIEKDLKIEPKRFTMPKPTYLALSLKSSNAMTLAPKLANALEELRASGELMRINNQYLDKELSISDRYCPQHVEAVTIDW